jgi:hypothetical protein
MWLGLFIISQLVLVGLGLLPETMWRSSIPRSTAKTGKLKGKPAAA